MKGGMVLAVSLAWGMLGSILLKLSFNNAVMALAMIDGLAWLLIFCLLLDKGNLKPTLETR